MSIEVRVPKEITEYKEKILFGLSLRQLIFFVLAILVSGSSYFIMTMLLEWDKDLVGYIVMVEAAPLLAFGFIRKNGFTFEKYAALVLRHKFGIHKRPYKTNVQIDGFITKEVREGKYDWIFKKGTKTGHKSNKPDGKARATAKTNRIDRKRREYQTVTPDVGSQGKEGQTKKR